MIEETKSENTNIDQIVKKVIASLLRKNELYLERNIEGEPCKTCHPRNRHLWLYIVKKLSVFDEDPRNDDLFYVCRKCLAGVITNHPPRDASPFYRKLEKWFNHQVVSSVRIIDGREALARYRDGSISSLFLQETCPACLNRAKYGFKIIDSRVFVACETCDTHLYELGLKYRMD